MPEVRERGRTNYVRKKFKRYTKVQVQEMRKGLHNGKPQPLSPEEVIEMDWLAENIIGRIPKIEELQEQAKPVLTQQGSETRKG